MKVYKKLAEARVKFQELNVKKSGKNTYAKFNYYELTDIIPEVNKIFNEIGLIGVFGIKEELATLTIYSVEDESKIEFSSTLAEDQSQIKNPIQKLGATHTYLKRYLYLNALELTENDQIDAIAGKPEKATKNKAVAKPTKEIEELKKLIEVKGVKKEDVFKKYNISASSTAEDFKKAIEGLRSE